VARFRGSFPRNQRSPRRKTEWGLGPGGPGVTGITASQNNIIGSAIQALEPGVTVGRIRGEFMAYLSLATSSLDGFTGAFGIGMATLAAFNAGVASLPTPVTEDGWDGWMYHRFLAFKAGFAYSTGADPGGNLMNALRFEVDVKAMRKLDRDMVIYAATEFAEVGTANLQVYFDSRALAILP